MLSRIRVGCITLLMACPALAIAGSEPGTPEALPIAPAPRADARILGVMPDYQTVRDSSKPVPALTASQKWRLALREAADPFNLANAAMTAAFSQRGNQT